MATEIKIDMKKGPFLPCSVYTTLNRVAVAKRHPGLQLDKFSAGGTQKENQGEALKEVVKTEGNADLLASLHLQRTRLLDAVGATRFAMSTNEPLTLHLSRASALENAGIALHPLHGFVYLPGSGLKGMARAWAETNGEPADRIADVFGSGPKDKDHPDNVSPDNVSPDNVGPGNVGAVVFHDAWPKSWPKLRRDIVTNHHRNYYRGDDAPGDWEHPNPVTFLAVGAGEFFDFALSPRAGGDPAQVEQARKWLQAALCWRGAGAKTNAGYGAFKIDTEQASTAQDVPEPDATREPRERFTLTLTSPGFFAGADRGKHDCDLRSASLRGQLRWWWRTLHAGRMRLEDLKRCEAKIWGDTTRAGMVRVAVKKEKAEVCCFDKNKNCAKWSQKTGREANNSGLWYASYGMNEKNAPQRCVVEPGAKWSVTLMARQTQNDFDPTTALHEAKAALWLLCRYGGVGSRSRKGFGSFADIDTPGVVSDMIEQCRQRTRAPNNTRTPALEDAIFAEYKIQGDSLVALDKVWGEIKNFAGNYKHNREKLALGLPRKIHGPKKEPLDNEFKRQDKNTHKKPKNIGKSKDDRHAAPYFIHVGPVQNGHSIIRFTAFPAAYLPDFNKSREMLDNLKKCLDEKFQSK